MNLIVRVLPMLVLAAQVMPAKGQDISLENAVPATNAPNVSFNSTVSTTSNFDAFLTLGTALRNTDGPEYEFSLQLQRSQFDPWTLLPCNTRESIAHHVELHEDGQTVLLLSRGSWPGSRLARGWLVDTNENDGFCPPPTSDQPQRGWLSLLELQAVGGLSGAFSQNGDWLVIGAPGAIVDDENAMTGAVVTEGSISVYQNRSTGWHLIRNSSIVSDLGSRESLTPLNGEAGAAVAISDDGSTIAVSHPARRPTAIENPPSDIPGGPIPAGYGTTFPSGIFIGNFSLSGGFLWQFFELPKRNHVNPEISAYPFQGITEMNTNLRVSRDGDYVYYLRNEGVTVSSNRVILYTFQRHDEAWQLSASQVLVADEGGQPQGAECWEGTGPSWFAPGTAVATDLLVSSDQQRLAVAVVPEAGLNEDSTGLVCLFEKDTLGHWQILNGSGSQSAAAMASANLPFQRNPSANGITRLQGNDELSKILVPSYNGGYVLNINWEETAPTSLPLWLLFEASKTDQN